MRLYDWVAPAYNLTEGRPSLAALVLQEIASRQYFDAALCMPEVEWERRRVVLNSDADATNVLTIRRYLDHGIPMCL